jgi:hypothetical protein
MFNELKSVPKSKDLSKSNKALTEAINAVKSKHPHMFLQEHEMHLRNFYHEPDSPVMLNSFVVPSPTRMKYK